MRLLEIFEIIMQALKWGWNPGNGSCIWKHGRFPQCKDATEKQGRFPGMQGRIIKSKDVKKNKIHRGVRILYRNRGRPGC
jgi:hypothetical protein